MIHFRSMPGLTAAVIASHIFCGAVYAQHDRVTRLDSDHRATLSQERENTFVAKIQPLLTQYCIGCHNVDEMTSGIRVDHLNGTLEDEQIFLWKDILEQVSSESMPPEDEPRPTDELRRVFIEWIRQTLVASKSHQAGKNGSVRRLTVSQYRNTLRDLLGIEEDLTDVLPADAVSKHGFVNNEQTMVLSPLLVEAYFEIAEKVLDRCIVDEHSRPAIQNFRMDLGAAINEQPCTDRLVLGALSHLLENKDFVVTQLTPTTSFDFDPLRMQTQFKFIEGYQGNATVRGWRMYDSIYHAVFACVRGTEGYPKGHAWETIPDGLLLRPAIPSSEIFGQASTYGPMANFKIALRELPDQGQFRVTVKTAKYADGLLLDPVTEPQDEPTENAITVTELTDPTTVNIMLAGIYQLDIYLKPVSKPSILPDASRLHDALIGVWPLDADARSQSGEKELVGRLVGESKFVDSPFGKAISVDGNTGFVAIPPHESMNVAGAEFTIAAWIHPRELRQAGIVCRGSYGYTHGWVFDMPDSNGVLRIETANGDGQHNGSVQSWPGVIRAGQWQHVAVVVRRGANNTQLYVNGYEVGSGTVEAVNLDNPQLALHIGRVPGSALFAGEIDDVRIYRRALGIAELEALLEPGREFSQPPPPSNASGNLVLRLGDRHFSGILTQPAFMAVRLPIGPLTLIAESRDTLAIERVVFTPLKDDQCIAKRFRKFENRSPHVGVHVGLRRDCGSTLTQVGKAQTVSSTELQEFVFEGAIGNFPSPDVEEDNVNYLAGIREIAVRSEYIAGRDVPRLLIRSIEFVGPMYRSWPPVTHQNIFIDSSNEDDLSVYAREVIRSFATKAFRRPITNAEEASLYVVWKDSFSKTSDFRESIKDTLLVVLTSPQFLFLIEKSEGPHAETLDDYELATKLSYFLWNTVPDNQLFELARNNTLHDCLDAEIERMIGDPRFAQFVEEFTTQWLNLDKLDIVEIDKNRFPKLTRDTKAALRNEPIQLLQHLIRHNLPLRNLIQSDFILANEVVAHYYGLDDHMENGFEFVAMRHGNDNLGGILSQAGILAGLSNGRESNPVKRGAWLARKIIAEPPDDPPPNIPTLEEDTTHLSLRERLERHRNQQGCARCHDGIDPWGLPFEQFDAGGLLKKETGLETRATLPDKTEVANLNDLKAYLVTDRIDRVAFSFIKHLAVYAIARNLSYSETELLKETAVELRANEYRMQDMVRFVIKNRLFLEK